VQTAEPFLPNKNFHSPRKKLFKCSSILSAVNN